MSDTTSDTTEFEAENVPDALLEREIWLPWHYETREDKNGDPYETKVPENPVGPDHEADPTDPDKTVAFEAAVDYAREHDKTHSIGFAFHEGDMVAGVDLDDVRDPETGDVREWARDVLDRLDSYTERSPSGTGYHVVVLGFKPGDRCKRKRDDGETEIEAYDDSRFFTFTGDRVEDYPASVEQRHNELGEVYHEYLDPSDEDGDDDPDAEAPDLDLDDEDVLEKARDASNGEKFERLWNGYDPQNDTSYGDKALCQMLAFWTGGDEHQMDRLFRASGRLRDKWDEDRGDVTYGERTIDAAVSDQNEFYEPGSGGPPDPLGRDRTAVQEEATDGGVTATAGGGGADGTDGPGIDHDALGPSNVVLAAGGDPEEDAAADLSDREKAFYSWGLIDRRDDHHFVAAQPDGTIFYESDGLWVGDGEQRLRELGREALGPAYSRNVHVELQEQVRSAAPMDRADLGSPPGTLAVGNGLLDLDTGTLDPLEPGDYATFRASAEYDPDADCPRFRQFVNDVVREGDVDTLQEYAGYTLLHWDQPYKRALLLLGPQDSGKSTFLNVIKDILGGRENVAAENLNSLVNGRWGKAQLFGKVANITNELETKELESVGLFKTLTGGGDTISAEFKGKDKFEFVPTAKQLFATNQVPPTKHSDDAFYSRWVFSTFPQPVPKSEQVPGLDAKMLEEERSGILNWMLEGYERLQDQRGFSNDRAAGVKRERWEAYGDSIARFKHNCLQTTGQSGDAVAKSVAYDFYSVYCREKIGSGVESQQKFTTELKKDDSIGDSKRKLHPEDKRRKVYTGVRYHSDATDALGFEPGTRLAELREEITDDEPDETRTENLSGFGGDE